MYFPVATIVTTVTAVVTSIHTSVVPNRDVTTVTSTSMPTAVVPRGELGTMVTINPLSYLSSCYAPSPVPTRIREQSQLASSLANTLWSIDTTYEHAAMAKSAASAVAAAMLKESNSAELLYRISLGQRALTDYETDAWYKQAVPTDVQNFLAAYHRDREEEAERAVGHPANMLCENEWTRSQEFYITGPGPKGYQYGC